MMRPLLKRLSRMIPTSLLQRILLSRSVNENFPDAAQSPGFPDRVTLWQDLFAKHLSGPICVLEFGVWQGDSLRSFTEFNTHSDSRFFGFDSFEGLPEDWRPGFAKGAFSTQGALPDIQDTRVRFVKGWFNQSFEPFVAEQPELFASIAAGRCAPCSCTSMRTCSPQPCICWRRWPPLRGITTSCSTSSTAMRARHWPWPAMPSAWRWLLYGHNAFPAAAGVARVSGRIRKRH